MFLVVARVGKPHGIRGDVTVEVRTDFPEQRFVLGAKFYLNSSLENSLTLSRVSCSNKFFILGFNGIDTRDEAEKLRNSELLMLVENEDEEEDAWYEEELLGFTVVSVEGKPVGKVSGLRLGVAQDILLVVTGAGEIMVPLVADIVVEISEEDRFVLVDLPAGLLELNSSQSVLAQDSSVDVEK